MASRHARRADFLLAHPSLDLPATIAITVALGIGLDALPMPEESMRSATYGGAASLAGLALAAATFACSMTYQSANILLERVRRTYAGDLRKNWMSIIIWLLASAVLAIVAATIDGWSARAAMCIAAFSLTMTCVKALRAMFWLGYTLFMDEVEQARPQAVEGPATPERLKAREQT